MSDISNTNTSCDAKQLGIKSWSTQSACIFHVVNIGWIYCIFTLQCDNCFHGYSYKQGQNCEIVQIAKNSHNIAQTRLLLNSRIFTFLFSFLDQILPPLLNFVHLVKKWKKWMRDFSKRSDSIIAGSSCESEPESGIDNFLNHILRETSPTKTIF